MRGGTTIFELTKVIPKNLVLTIFTISPQIAVSLFEYVIINVFTIGGQLKKNHNIHVGSKTINELSRFRFDLCFMGINALSVERGMTDIDMEVVEVNRAMLNVSDKDALLTISEKMNLTKRYQISDLSDIDCLIILLYFLMMLGLAFWFKKFASGGMENFFLGGRKTPGWINGISYTSALVSPYAATVYGGLAVTKEAFISWWWRRFNGKARITDSFGGFFFLLVVLVPKALIWMRVEWANQMLLPWWWQTLVIMLLTIILWVVVVFVTAPESDALLDSFYEKARPLGWWKRNDNRGLELAQLVNVNPIILGILVAIVGFSATCGVTLGLSDLWFAKHMEGRILLGSSVLLFIIFRISLRAYLDGLEKRFEQTNE